MSEAIRERLRILVAAAFEAGSHFAHAINTVKMAQGFASLGHEVTIVCRASSEGRLDHLQLSADYGVADSIRWIQSPSRLLNLRIGPDWGFAVLALAAALRVRPHLVYARNYTVPYLTSLFGIPTAAETHAHPDNRTRPFLRLMRASANRRFGLLVTISGFLADSYCSLGAPREKIGIFPSGSDVGLFGRPNRLPTSPYNGRGPVVAYSGHLYDYKGIPTILEAAALLPDVQFHFIGGLPEDIGRQTERSQSLGLSNIFFHGMKLHAEVPPYLWHADALLLAPSASHPSAQWTSPVKLGEYLASGTPVVATSIPALQDWLTDKEVRFVEPDNPRRLAEGIEDVLRNKPYANGLSLAGMKKAALFSYERRAKAIIERMQSWKVDGQDENRGLNQRS
ncbi:MAG: hypothetical protein Kow0099_15020 [Candidatus Abyssubacteria bacterium]